MAAIETLDVDPDFQGRGIGRRLLQAAEEEMNTLGLRKIRLEVSANNLAALRLYEKAGFKVAALLPNYYLNPSFGTRHAFRMIKDLSQIRAGFLIPIQSPFSSRQYPDV